MIAKILFFLFIFLSNVVLTICQIEKGWNGIQIFQTKRKQIENLYGQPINEFNSEFLYQKGNETLLVKYSSKPCSNSGIGRFKVPLNTVLYYKVSFKEGIALSDIAFNKTLYEKAEATHSKYSVYYFNNKDGIQITTDISEKTEKVVQIRFNTTERKSLKYLCKKFK